MMFKKPSPDALRASLLDEHKRRLIAAELNYEHARANLEMQRRIIARLESEQVDAAN